MKCNHSLLWYFKWLICNQRKNIYINSTNSLPCVQQSFQYYFNLQRPWFWNWHTLYSWLQYVITSLFAFTLVHWTQSLKNADVGFLDLKERFLLIKTVLRVLSDTNICAIDKLKVGMPSKYLMWLNKLLSFLFFYRLVSSVMLSSKVAFYWFKRIHLTISHEAGNKNQAIRGQYWNQRINSRWQWKRYRLNL